MDRLHVATFNILNLADRWPERLPLILADMAALQPDLLALQEVVYVMQQDRLIGASGEGRYTALRGWAGRPEYGNSLLVREPLVGGDVARLDLGLQRAAHRTVITLPAGATVLVAVTHLHHAPPVSADPKEPAYARMLSAGFRSAFVEANGAEPSATWPSGLQAPAMDTDGDPDCLDYIWLRGAARVSDARLVFDRPDPDDP